MTHEMELTAAHEGTEEWFCPVCGRRVLIEWHPWRKVTLDPGDPTAAHSASKGLRMSVEIRTK